MESEMGKSKALAEQAAEIKTQIEALPDEKDGINLSQYKMQAQLTADQLAHHLAVLSKLLA